MARDTVFKTKSMQLMEKRLGRPLDEVLRELYHQQGKTLAEVGAVLDVRPETVSRWMTALGIDARFPGQRGTPVPALDVA